MKPEHDIRERLKALEQAYKDEQAKPFSTDQRILDKIQAGYKTLKWVLEK